jgi:isochorismate synthase
MAEILQKTLQKRWDLQRPFVFFSHPNERLVHHYWQEDEQLVRGSVNDTSGFFFAPFRMEEDLVFIPDQHHRTFDRPEAKTLPEHLDLPPKGKAYTPYIKGIEQAIEQIHKGHFKKVVLSRSIDLATKTENPLTLFLAMLSYFPKAMVYLWHHPEMGTWLGASPEQFLKVKGDQLQTMALAGTLPRSDQPQWSTKEMEEQALVVEDILNVLTKEFPKNTVIPSPVYNKTAGNLVHLCTDITVTAATIDVDHISRALHPTPAVGGVPSGKAVEYILKNEGYDRAYYSGFFGPTTKQDTHLFVNLRCLKWTAETTTLYVGGGITAKSRPEAEWEETQRKASVLFNLCEGNL